jgi:hypothetical protein
MSNLEQLRLYFTCSRKQSFIDGNDLKINIINYLPPLKTFKFNICSFIENYNQIISCVDYFPDKNEGQCHIYPYPFTLASYERITNNFPGGLFPRVRKISLFDEHPFEHEFFLRLRHSFPLLKDLTVTNWKAQYQK